MADSQLMTLIAIGVPACVAFGASAVAFARERTTQSLVQLVGAGFLMVVVFVHVAEAFDVFPWMGWGAPNSLGHYVDLVSVIAGLILLPIGYISRRIARSRTSN